MKMMLKSGALLNLITPSFAHGQLPDTIEVQKNGCIKLISPYGSRELIATPIHRDWLAKDVTIPFNRARWAKLYKFLHTIPDQPVVFQIDHEGENMSLSQITAQF